MPKPAEVSEEALLRQPVLKELANRIAGVDEAERYRIPGYAGLVLDAEKATLDVYWKGAPPGVVTAILADPPRGITVKLHSARFSAAELEAGRQRLVSGQGNQAALEAVADWHSISILPEGAGLSVGFEPRATAAQLASADTVAISRDVALKVEGIAGVPVQAYVKPKPKDTTRAYDQSPWRAGGQLHPQGGGFCTTGFTGWRGGAPVILTAAHCGASGWYANGNNILIGSVVASRADRDISVIGVQNGTVGPYYYDGPWDDSAGYAKHVVGANYNNNGDFVCASGAMSGVRCNLKVYNDNTVFKGEDGVTRGPAILAKRIYPTDIAIAQGDSGGPIVASPDGTYGGNMEARGIISASDGNYVVCPVWGEGTAGETICYEGVAYIAIRRVLSDFGVVIAT
ncbi:S1 family peptidase [Embleya sp. AB8]|uniref:S1 family peptidase n=1 Tax=Embleya sp. AB8 TaxID=3156304 RepID=UPI003C76E116